MNSNNNSNSNRYLALPTLVKRTIEESVNKHSGNITTKEDIENAAFNIAENLLLFPTIRKVPYNRILAYCYAMVAKKGVKDGAITIGEYMRYYAEHKLEIEQELQDYGAFGDVLEILVRLAFVRKNFRNYTQLSVKASNQIDLISKRLGRIEIGHNGKTLTQATLFDYMAGNYDAVIYGCFDAMDKEEIYAACIQHNYESAIDYVKEYACVWTNKYNFQMDMDNLTRGGGIVLKGFDIQIVYNESKYNAFQRAVEDGKFITLKEFLQD